LSLSTAQAPRVRWGLPSTQAGNPSIMCALGLPSKQAGQTEHQVAKAWGVAGGCGLSSAQAWQPSAKCSQSQWVCLHPGAWVLQATTSAHAPTKQCSPQ